MSTVFLIIVAIIIGFLIWWFKGAKDAFILKDNIIYFLVNDYGLSRNEAIILIDSHIRYVFELYEMKMSPSEIADRLYKILNQSYEYSKLDKKSDMNFYLVILLMVLRICPIG